MKTIYFARHAKSDWNEEIPNDFDRPLNKRGERAAPFMGEKLNELGIRPDIIISSPANRAITTARYIAGKLNYPTECILEVPELYNASAAEILKVVNASNSEYHSIMVFGHNPGMSRVTSNVSGESLQFPTCAIASVEVDVSDWNAIGKETGTLAFFMYPKQFDEMNR